MGFIGVKMMISFVDGAQPRSQTKYWMVNATQRHQRAKYGAIDKNEWIHKRKEKAMVVAETSGFTR